MTRSGFSYEVRYPDLIFMLFLNMIFFIIFHLPWLLWQLNQALNVFGQSWVINCIADNECTVVASTWIDTYIGIVVNYWQGIKCNGSMIAMCRWMDINRMFWQNNFKASLFFNTEAAKETQRPQRNNKNWELVKLRELRAFFVSPW